MVHETVLHWMLCDVNQALRYGINKNITALSVSCCSTQSQNFSLQKLCKGSLFPAIQSSKALYFEGKKEKKSC